MLWQDNEETLVVTLAHPKTEEEHVQQMQWLQDLMRKVKEKKLQIIYIDDPADSG